MPPDKLVQCPSFYKIDHSGSVLLKYEQNIQQTGWLAIQADILEANILEANERLQSIPKDQKDERIAHQDEQQNQASTTYH
ncbi:hypothetical protein INT45_000870 [Circinella minor]|uniref:Uncharacterized protein n=1 Tax=Circinella minor TaxID=1195481 RepID=A0A8H7VK54_9FUNG|nr:hypothetical protein INT45_000870 [Circinella minor]